MLDIELGYGKDIFTVESTHEGSTIIHSGDGDDEITVESLVGHTFVHTGAGSDEVDVRSEDNLVDEIGGLLTVLGGADDDIVRVDDTGDDNNNSGTLTQTTLTGLDMPGVSEVQVLTVSAASGTYLLTYPQVGGDLVTGALNYNLTRRSARVGVEQLARVHWYSSREVSAE